MTKEEFKKCLEREVYTSKSGNPIKQLYYRIIDRYLNPSHEAIFLIRKMQYLAGMGGVINNLRALYIQKKIVKKYSMYVSPYCKIGIGLRLPHPVGIVIGAATEIGNNVSIYQNVTIGGARTGDVKQMNQPHIGNNVTLFAGSLILGKVNVVDNVTLGANSVLLKNAEVSGIYAGSPAKLINK